ncbi:MAG: hypothetical protein KBD56_07745 [Candidatus Eisenbacteria bacterium]|nr:hypothetical protein [Candidatus Eisenbacteria bacterium]
MNRCNAVALFRSLITLVALCGSLGALPCRAQTAADPAPASASRLALASSLYAEAGYGRATFEFQRPGEPTFTRSMLDLEAGLRRSIGLGGSLRLGTSAALMLALDRPLDDSYSCLALDMLALEGAHGPWRARAGMGLVRIFAPVHELAAALFCGIAVDTGPFFLGAKARAARFEVDFEPHGIPPDVKHDFFYAALVVGRSWQGK